MKYKKRKMNEIDLIRKFSKEELMDLLGVQVQYENYEGAKVVKNAIDRYDEYNGYLFIEDDELDDEEED